MATLSTDESKVLSETDLFSHTSKSFSLKSDCSSVNEEHHSWRYLAKTYFNNSKQLKTSKSNLSIKDHSSGHYYKNLPGAMPITMNEMLKAHNTNAPWLFNVIKKKLHRSRKHKKDRQLSNEIDSNNTIMNNSILSVEEFFDKAINNDGTDGKWIVNENDIVCPLIKNFDALTSGQYNISRAMSSSTSPILPLTNDSLPICHYHYDFETLNAPNPSASSYLVDYQGPISSDIIDENKPSISNDEDTPLDTTKMLNIHHASNREQIDLHNMPDRKTRLSTSPLISSLVDDAHLLRSDPTIQTKSKRAKSASAARTHRVNSSLPTKREKAQIDSTKKKRSKYYQEHKLTPEEIELREALRIIDLDNIGFFPPNQLRRVLKEIGINSNDIDKIEKCLPLDDDGHYSVDNLVKLFLSTESK